MASFPGRYDSLSKISLYVRAAAEDAGLSSTQVYAVQLAVDEACSNIIEHGYGGEDRGVIDCCCQASADGLRIILHDTGRPFDPTTIPLPDPVGKPSPSQTGGLGVFLIRKLMDEVVYEFSPQKGNTCTLVKRIHSTG